MILEQHVPSRELCEEWKRRGGRQDTTLFWFEKESGDWVVWLDAYDKIPGGKIAAPLCSEMMEWEQEFDIRKRNFVYDIQTTHWLKIELDNLPNALMEMMLERMEVEK